MSVQSSFQFEPSALDSLGLALVLYNDLLEPIYLSSRAAQQLSIRDRSTPAQHESALQPLQSLARALSEARPAQTTEHKQRIEEVQLESADSRKLFVLALAREVEIHFQAKSILGSVVVFYDLTIFQPFLLALEQARKVRPTLVLASALLGRPLADVNAEELMNAAQSAALETAPDHTSRLQLREQSTDLLTNLTLGLEIVDRLMPPTFRIALDVTTSALLAVSRSAFLRILCHTLLEAGDFAGPYGRARLAAILRRSESAENPKRAPSSVQLLVLAQRVEPTAVDTHPLDLYAFRKCISSSYKITGSNLERGGELTPEEQSFLEKHLGKETLQRTSLAGSAVPEELYSENLRIASHLVQAERAALEVRLLPQNHLWLSVTFPLVGGASGEQRAVQQP